MDALIMKKLINGVDNIVDEMLEGMVAAYPQYIRRLDGFDVVVILPVLAQPPVADPVV